MRFAWLGVGVVSLIFGAVAASSSCSSSSGSCVVDGKTHKVGEPFKDAENCNTCTCMANGDVACTTLACLEAGAAGQGGDAAADAQLEATPYESPDAPAETTPDTTASDAGACTFSTTYSFWDDGGLRAYSDESTLTPARTHSMERTAYFGSDGKRSCSRVVACTSGTAVTVPAIEAAIAHADVQAALAKPAGMLYGGDPRPVDGTVWVFKRADGRSFMVGSGNVPAGLAALEALLRKLTNETLATTECAALTH